MLKQLKKIIGILAGLLIAQNTYAAFFSAGFDTYNSPYLNAVNYFSEDRPMTSSISDGRITYEDTDGTGTLSMSSFSALFGDISIDNAALTTNNNGSLHVNGTIDFLTLNSSASFIGDIAVTSVYSEFDDVSTFGFSPIAFEGSNHDGLFMIDGPLAGLLLEFNATSTFLAYVDNPFPTYSPVPVPAAVWLFGSGFLALFGLVKKKSHA